MGGIHGEYRQDFWRVSLESELEEMRECQNRRRQKRLRATRRQEAAAYITHKPQPLPRSTRSIAPRCSLKPVLSRCMSAKTYVMTPAPRHKPSPIEPVPVRESV